jgi:hypothetical protein
LRQQCAPQTSALTSTEQFILPNIPAFFQLQGAETPPPMFVSTSDPVQWGPHLWVYLHTVSANYPDQPTPEQQEGMKTWLRTLKWTIPCKKCATHYGRYMEECHDLDRICASKQTLFEFLVNIHNTVNRRTGKREVTVEEAKAMYF